MTDEIKAFKKYKKAKSIFKELEEISKVVALSTKALTFYKKYVVVSQLLSSLQEAKISLDVNKKKVAEIISKKGVE